MSGLSEFRSFFKQFLGIVTAGVAATAVVLIASIAKLAPPWPIQVVELTAIAQLVALAFVFQFLRSAGSARIGRIMMRAALLCGLSLIVYLGSHSVLVFNLPDGSTAARGLYCSQDALTVYSVDCPILSDSQLAKAEYSSSRLWTPVGLLLSRMMLFVSWIFFFLSLVVVLGAFVVYQRRVT